MDVAREEVLLFTVFDEAAHGASDVAREVHGEGDFLAAATDDARVGDGHRREGVLDTFDVGLDVERVVLVAGLLALALHHLDGVAEQAADEEGGGGRSVDARRRVLLQQQRQRAQVVEVAVCQNHAVDVALDLVDLGQGLTAVEFGVEAAVDHQPQAAEFGEHAVGADLTARVQVGKSHQEGSVGGVMAKTGIRV